MIVQELEGQFFTAQNEAAFILEVGSEALIQKSLKSYFDVGQERTFKLMFDSIQIFFGKVQQAMGGLEREIKAATQFLQSTVNNNVIEEPEEDLVVDISPSK
jgi:hypothetical protein